MLNICQNVHKRPSECKDKPFAPGTSLPRALEYWSTVQRTTCAFGPMHTQPLPAVRLAHRWQLRPSALVAPRAPSVCTFHRYGMPWLRTARRAGLRPCAASPVGYGSVLCKCAALSTRSTRTSAVRRAAYQVSASDVYGTQHPPGCYQARLCSHSHACAPTLTMVHAASHALRCMLHIVGALCTTERVVAFAWRVEHSPLQLLSVLRRMAAARHSGACLYVEARPPSRTRCRGSLRSWTGGSSR